MQFMPLVRDQPRLFRGWSGVADFIINSQEVSLIFMKKQVKVLDPFVSNRQFIHVEICSLWLSIYFKYLVYRSIFCGESNTHTYIWFLTNMCVYICNFQPVPLPKVQNIYVSCIIRFTQKQQEIYILSMYIRVSPFTRGKSSFLILNASGANL